jgi:hypothetical protein
MLKKGLLAFILVCSVFIAWAQPDLTVQGTSGNLYIVHKVQPQENWYSIGRIYNLSPREIAPFNGKTLDASLSIGQELKIPLKSGNFDQQKRVAAGETLVPLFHHVKPQEWMFRISQQYNKVPVVNLESWNNIRNEDLKVGMDIIIGFLKVKTDESVLAKNGNAMKPSAVNNNSAAVATAPVNTNPSTGVSTGVNNPPVNSGVVTTTPPPVNNNTGGVPVKVIVDDPKTTTAEKPVTTPVVSNVDEEMPATSNTQSTISNTNKLVDHKGGYFKSQYKNGRKSTSGNSDIFKSTSGWSDGKYYALMNDVPVGTIISVTFPSTRKTVFVKVLGGLPDMRQSEGLTLRISDAAAAALGVSNSKFYVEVAY